MASGRTTRSSNHALPRKRYTNDLNSVYTQSESTGRSAKITSEDEASSDDDIPAITKPQTRAKKNRKRKQPVKLADRKGKGAAMPPAKKQRTAARESTPGLHYASAYGSFGLSPELDLPDLPRSTYAPSAIGEWTQFSDRMVNGQDKQQASDSAGEQIHEDEARFQISNRGALAVLEQELREKRAQGPAFVPEALERQSRGGSVEGSIVWVDASGMVPEEIAARQSTPARGRMHGNQHQQAESHVQSQRESSAEQPARIGPEDSAAERAQRGHSAEFAAWVANEQSSRGSSREADNVLNGVHRVFREIGNGFSEASEKQLLEQDQAQLVTDAHNVDHSDSGEGDFDVDFGEDDEPPRDAYDVDGSVNSGSELSAEAPLFVEGVPPNGDAPDLQNHEEADIANQQTGNQQHETEQGESEQGESEQEDGEQEEGEQEEGEQNAGEGDEATGGHLEKEKSQTSAKRPDPLQEFAYHDPAEDPFKAVVKSRDLAIILRHMNTRAWTKEGPKWEAELLYGYQKRLSGLDRQEINEERHDAGKPPLPMSNQVHPTLMWYACHRDEVELGKAREMLQHIYRVWHISREAPSANNLEAQVDYFEDGAGKGFRKSLSLCQSYVKYVCDRLPAVDERRLAWARSMRKSLCYRLIPLLGLLLKEAFMLASTRFKPKKNDHVQDLPEEVEATGFHLHTLLAITGWLKELTQAMLSEYAQNEPSNPRPDNWDTRMKQKWGVLRPVTRFEDAVKQAISDREIASDEPHRKVRVAENDRRERAKKEGRLREEREALERQQQLFRASLQAMPIRKRNEIAPSAPASLLSQTPKRTPTISPKEKYALENSGWYWDEDNMLMNALRRVDRPSARGLSHSLPGRSEDDIKKRLMELRDIGRKHYEAKGVEVPRWCQGYGWR